MLSLISGSYWMIGLIIFALLLAAGVGSIYRGNIRDGNLLADNLSEPLNGVTSAMVNVHSGTGNISVDRLIGDEQALASGTLQYFEKMGLPIRTRDSSNGQATLTLRGGNSGQFPYRLPWAACNGALEWQILLNPTVSSDITIYSGGGNVKLNLAGMAITSVSADTGGGNVDVVLPENAANLSATAKTGGGNVNVEISDGIQGTSIINASSGAGNVTVRVPSGVAAKIHATSGLGKVIVDPQFRQTDKNIYQSPDYDDATNKVEITVKSGAGNASVNTK